MRPTHLIAPILIVVAGYLGLKSVVDAEMSNAPLLESGFESGVVLSVTNTEFNSERSFGGRYGSADFGRTTQKFAIAQIEVDNGDDVRVMVPQKRFSKGDRVPLKVGYYEDGRRRYDYAPQNH